MHELSVANQAVDRILKTALDKGAKRIHRVEILIGELTLLGEEQLTFWMKEMLSTKGEIASDVKIELKQVQAIIKCRECGYQGTLKPANTSHFYPVFLCPGCGGGDMEIKEGRDCVLNRIHLEV